MSWIQIRADNYPVDSIQGAFETAFIAAGCPPEAALFLRPLPEGGADYFVSPAATGFFAAVIRANNGQPCPPPSPNGILFLVGHDDARTMLSAAKRG